MITDDARGARVDGRRQFRRGLEFLGPDRRLTALVVVVAVLLALASALEPLILKYVFDRLGGDQALDALVRGVLLLLALGVAREGLGAVSNWLSWRVRLRVHERMLAATVERLHALPLSYHRGQSVGALMTRLDRGISGFVSALSEFAFHLLPAAAYLLLALLVMLQIDWRMTLVVLVFAPLPGFVAARAAPEQVARERGLLDRWAAIYGRFNEVLSGIVTVKSFAMEDVEKRRFLESVHAANRVVEKGVATDSRSGALRNLVTALARIAALFLGGFLVVRGEVTIGTVVAFLGYIASVFGPVQGITGIYQTVRKAAVSLDAIFSILDVQDRLGDAPDAIVLEDVKGAVEFESVTFGYRPDERILEGFDLRVEPGERIALVGPSGCGKSTLMALLQRLYDPDSGVVRIDGHDIRRVRQRSLRQTMGVVLQEALIFDDTVRNAIAYGRPAATQEEIEAAARAANAHAFIQRLPEGYDTKLGERGSRLSVGERQRIGIARALLKEPRIVILDEATSALDAESEALVQRALARLIRGRTTFVIAHRLATVVDCDRILVLQKGRVVETGTHDELLARRGYYAFLVEHQTRGLLRPDRVDYPFAEVEEG